MSEQLKFGEKTFTFERASDFKHECIVTQAFPDAELPDLVLEVVVPTSKWGSGCPYWAMFKLRGLVVTVGTVSELLIYPQGGPSRQEALDRLYTKVCQITDLKQYLEQA